MAWNWEGNAIINTAIPVVTRNMNTAGMMG
jgi:hypothetical protein